MPLPSYTSVLTEEYELKPTADDNVVWMPSALYTSQRSVIYWLSSVGVQFYQHIYKSLAFSIRLVLWCQVFFTHPCNCVNVCDFSNFTTSKSLTFTELSEYSFQYEPVKESTWLAAALVKASQVAHI